MRRSTVLLPGAKQSLHTGQQLVSSGNSALDHILGGGLPIGSILLIEEDKFARYSKYLSKLFLSEGSVHKHALFLASLNNDPNETIQKLPPAIPETKETKSSSKTPDISNLDQLNDDMRIAWCYNNLNKVDSEQGNNPQKNAYIFDLTQSIDEDLVKELNVTTFGDEKSSTTSSAFTNSVYNALLEKLREKVTDETFHVTVNAATRTPQTAANVAKKNLLRICIESLASPLWFDERFTEDLCLFLTILKGMVRSSLSVCCIRMPTHLLNHIDPAIIHRIRDLVDYAVELKSFAGSDEEANPVFSEYNGLFYIRKMVALNSLNAHTPETYDLAFKLRRKRFVIEKLHLPPELQLSEQREQNDEAIASAMTCGSTTKHILEF